MPNLNKSEIRSSPNCAIVCSNNHNMSNIALCLSTRHKLGKTLLFLKVFNLVNMSKRLKV